MSRTYRRKNIENTLGSSFSRKGRKSGGFYNTYDRESLECKYTKRTQYEEDGLIFIECRTGYTWVYSCPIYRPMTKEERRNRWLFLHGESRHANMWTPGRWYRQNRESQLRSHNRTELIKYMKDPDNYEPMVFDGPLSHLWDWR